MPIVVVITQIYSIGNDVNREEQQIHTIQIMEPMSVCNVRILVW